MIRDKELEPQVYEAEHIQQVLSEIASHFTEYWETFAEQPLAPVFDKQIEAYLKERDAYREYLDLDALTEYDYDPNAFKSHTRKRCPIIRRCLMSPDEVMKAYRKSFSGVIGRQLLDVVRHIAEFGRSYRAHFDDTAHESASSYDDLGLEPLNEDQYGCSGVIGYGVQSSLLYGIYAREFAHRSQAAVWSLYFLSGRKDFGLSDGSEFLMIRPNDGICEQNFFYPAELFGYYALQVYKMVKAGCRDRGLTVQNRFRYIYLNVFCDHVADTHRNDINTYRRSSEYVESQPWF